MLYLCSHLLDIVTFAKQLVRQCHICVAVSSTLCASFVRNCDLHVATRSTCGLLYRPVGLPASTCKQVYDVLSAELWMTPCLVRAAAILGQECRMKNRDCDEFPCVPVTKSQFVASGGRGGGACKKLRPRSVTDKQKAERRALDRDSLHPLQARTRSRSTAV